MCLVLAMCCMEVCMSVMVNCSHTNFNLLIVGFKATLMLLTLNELHFLVFTNRLAVPSLFPAQIVGHIQQSLLLDCPLETPESPAVLCSHSDRCHPSNQGVADVQRWLTCVSVHRLCIPYRNDQDAWEQRAAWLTLKLPPPVREYKYITGKRQPSQTKNNQRIRGQEDNKANTQQERLGFRRSALTQNKQSWLIKML